MAASLGELRSCMCLPRLAAMFPARLAPHEERGVRAGWGSGELR